MYKPGRSDSDDRFGVLWPQKYSVYNDIGPSLINLEKLEAWHKKHGIASERRERMDEALLRLGYKPLPDGAAR